MKPDDLLALARQYFSSDLVDGFVTEIKQFSGQSNISFSQLSQEDQIIKIEYALLYNKSLIDVTLSENQIKTWAVRLNKIICINKVRSPGILKVFMQFSQTGALHYSATTLQAIKDLNYFVDYIRQLMMSIG